MTSRNETTAGKGNIALVGFGYWGRNLARNLHQLGELASICDESPRALESARQSYPGARHFPRFEDLVSDPDIAAAVIAAPAAQHYALARECLRAGKDVLVEKPLALNVPEAEELVAIAKSHDRVLMVGHLLEYHPAIQKLKEIVDAGELGDVHYAYSNRLNLGKIRKEENILWSFAPHDVSVILLLLGGLPEQVSTTGGTYLQRGVPDVTMTCLTFPRGVQAHIFVSWLHPFKEQKLVVVGSRKMAVFDDVAKEGKLKIYDKGIEWQDGEPIVRQTAESTLFVPETEPLRAELAHFIECVRTRGTPRTDGQNGLRVLRVLDACQRSVKGDGRPVGL